MKKQLSYNLEWKLWTVEIRDQTARPVQSDLDLHCEQKASCVIISKERVNAWAKSIDSCQPAQFGQADMGRNFSLSFIFYAIQKKTLHLHSVCGKRKFDFVDAWLGDVWPGNIQY